MQNVQKNIIRLIIVRILLVTSFLGIAATVLKVERSFFYLLIASVYFVSIIYLVWFLKKKHLAALSYVQILVDSVVITITVLGTGSSDSVFTTLYILNILSATIIAAPLACMLTAAFTSSLYIGQLCLTYYDMNPWMPFDALDGNVSLILYNANVHIISFLLAGILSSSLARRVYQMEEAMKEKERISLLGELAAEIAHEIRNPLTSISASVEILFEELKGRLNEQNEELMKAIVSESHRMSAIFEQFLDFTKLNVLHYGEHRLADVLNEVLLLVNTHPRSKNCTIEKQYSGDTTRIVCDRNKIKQVFINIISNAFDAMSDGGTLGISIVCSETLVSVVFSDSGSGMDEATQKTIFHAFQTSKGKGYGLGLAISNKIVEKHGGYITITSKPGVGTKVIVVLPIYSINE